ncbi:MAG TPA: S-methyl-5-thioribose kinase [Rectinemataceae bacterium]
MGRFDSHFRMDEKDVEEYARLRLSLFKDSGPLEVREIGDGNINYVFRVADRERGISAIIKHADRGTRSGSRILGFDRNRIEAEILKLEGELAPGLAPQVYDYDPVMACVAMEDLSDHRILRYALIDREIFPRLAQDMASFVARTTVPTLDMVMAPEEKKVLVQRYTNPALCAITEQLVYTEPYTNRPGRTKVFPPNAEFMGQELFADMELRLEVAKLKYSFMNDAQALIHGDLHSGSIFVKIDSTKVIDPEFAYFGPIGYDLGNFLGNLCFARVRAQAAAPQDEKTEAFLAWIDGCMVETVDRFSELFLELFAEKAVDPMGRTPGYAKWLLDRILSDTAGVAGLEMIRRIVGVAQVRDIAGIEDAGIRASAERVLVLAAKRFIVDRDTHRRGKDYLATLVE